MPFPSSEGRHQTHTNRFGIGGGQGAKRVEIHARTVRVEPAQIDGVQDRSDLDPIAELPPGIGADAFGIGHNRRAARTEQPQQP
jgi:hypothetical protein